MAKGDQGGMPGGGGQSSYLNAIGSGMSAGADQGSAQQKPGAAGDDGMGQIIKMLMDQMWLKKQQPPENSFNPAKTADVPMQRMPQGFNPGDIGRG